MNVATVLSDALEAALASHDVQVDIVGDDAIVLHIAKYGVLALSTDVVDDRLVVRAIEIAVDGETASERRVRHLELARIVVAIMRDNPAQTVIDPHGLFGARGAS
jgi:hypothetical protein